MLGRIYGRKFDSDRWAHVDSINTRAFIGTHNCYCYAAIDYSTKFLSALHPHSNGKWWMDELSIAIPCTSQVLVFIIERIQRDSAALRLADLSFPGFNLMAWPFAHSQPRVRQPLQSHVHPLYAQWTGRPIFRYQKSPSIYSRRRYEPWIFVLLPFGVFSI